MAHGHAYCLPSDCFKHFLAQGSEPLNFDKFEHLGDYSYANETPRGMKIAGDLHEAFPGNGGKHIQMSYVEWKDDCESAKSNKISMFGMWIFTITIFVEKDKTDSPRATYPICIGPKSASHDPIEKIIAKDMQMMRSFPTKAILGARAVSYTHLPSPRDLSTSRMPSSA